MISKKYVGLMALGVCLVGLSVLGNTKNPVERPLKAVLHETLVVNLDNVGNLVSWEVFGTGTCSHLGLVENHGGGLFDELGNAVGTGVTTAANGDQIFWSSANQATSIFAGGTGRFAKATGSMNTVSMEMELSPDSTPTRVVYEVLIYNEGTITY